MNLSVEVNNNPSSGLSKFAGGFLTFLIILSFSYISIEILKFILGVLLSANVWEIGFFLLVFAAIYFGVVKEGNYSDHG